MHGIIEKYKGIWGNDPTSVLESYDYYPDLTARLDTLRATDFDREDLYEIVLWKLGRFPGVEPDLVTELRGVASFKTHNDAREILDRLLRSPGIALPMASTILRFLAPNVFQIIDDRVYRVLFPKKSKFPPKPAPITDHYVETSTRIYFEYLDELHRVASKNLPFKFADRILYQLDILLGNKIGSRMPNSD